MLAFLMGALGNVWVRRAGVALVIVAVALGVRQHYIALGEQRGTVGARQESTQQVEGAHVADRHALEDQLAALSRRVDQADADRRAADADRARWVQLAGVLAVQRTQAQQAVAAVPDAGLHAFTVAKLALRAPADLAPGYTVAEERSIAECVSDRPIVAEQLKACQAGSAKADAQLKAADEKTVAVEAKRAALAGYTDGLEGKYTTLFNNQGLMRRAPRCLWLWHCGKVTLTAPAPVEAFAARPK